MSTYVSETASNLATSLASIEAQSVLPDQLVLVIDGPVGADQEDGIAAFITRGTIPTTLVRLPRNRGLAEALNTGLTRCLGEFILRMDSDDICTVDRIERQIAYAEAHPDIDVVASWSEEFFDDGAPCRIKVTPTVHEGIVRALRWRNVVHHPTLLIRKALTAISGYRSRYGFLEDYDLFVRLVLSGARFHAIPKVLVRIRSSTAQRSRRGGFKYWINDIRFRVECFRVGIFDIPAVHRGDADVFHFSPPFGNDATASLRPAAHLNRIVGYAKLLGSADEHAARCINFENRLSRWRKYAGASAAAEHGAAGTWRRCQAIFDRILIVVFCAGAAWPLLPRRYESTASVIYVRLIFRAITCNRFGSRWTTMRSSQKWTSSLLRLSRRELIAHHDLAKDPDSRAIPTVCIDVF